ncbi:MAG: hypothetical protein K2W96_22385 [Gemmataceae bacterium]|nr:hypothetical protein [Gemmataceae bacterium]
MSDKVKQPATGYGERMRCPQCGAPSSAPEAASGPSCQLCRATIGSEDAAPEQAKPRLDGAALGLLAAVSGAAALALAVAVPLLGFAILGVVVLAYCSFRRPSDRPRAAPPPRSATRTGPSRAARWRSAAWPSSRSSLASPWP